VTVHEGDAGVVLGELDGPFDLIFYDAFVPTPPDLEAFERLLRPGGVLVSSNLFLGRYVPHLPKLNEGARYREALVGGEAWLTAFSGHKAVSVRV
jgi:predicted O-methyltransferase YrrM